MKNTKNIVESNYSSFTEVNEANIDKKNLIIKKCCVFGSAESKNGYVYQPKAVSQIKDQTEGLHCYANHPRKSNKRERNGVRSITDFLGVFHNTTQEGDKIYSDLHCTTAAFPMMESIARLQPQGTGLSINAKVLMTQDEKSVTECVKLNSADCVSAAATTSNLFEAFTNENILENEVAAFLETIEIINEENDVSDSEINELLRNMKYGR